MAAITSNLIINPQSKRDEEALERALNSSTMPNTVLEHFKQNKIKTRNIEIGRLSNARESQNRKY